MPFAPPVGSPFKSNNKAAAGTPTKVSQPVTARTSSKRALPIPSASSSSASSATAGPKAKRARTADKAAASAAAPAAKADRVRLKLENGASSSNPKAHSGGKVQASLSSFFTVKPVATAFGLVGANHIPPPPRSATSPAGSFVSFRRTYASAPSEAAIASSAAADPSSMRPHGRSSAMMERKKIPSVAPAALERIDLVDEDEHDSDTDSAPKKLTVLPAGKPSTQAVKARKPRRKLTSAPTPTSKTSKNSSAPSDKAAAPGHDAFSTPMLLPVAAGPAVAAAVHVTAADDSIMMLDLVEDEQGSQVFHYA